MEPIINSFAHDAWWMCVRQKSVTNLWSNNNLYMIYCSTQSLVYRPTILHLLIVNFCPPVSATVATYGHYNLSTLGDLESLAVQIFSVKFFSKFWVTQLVCSGVTSRHFSLCSGWRDFNLRESSRGPSAIYMSSIKIISANSNRRRLSLCVIVQNFVATS